MKNDMNNILQMIAECPSVIRTRDISKVLDEIESYIGRTSDMQELRDKLCDRTFELHAIEHPKVSILPPAVKVESKTISAKTKPTTKKTKKK